MSLCKPTGRAWHRGGRAPRRLLLALLGWAALAAVVALLGLRPLPALAANTPLDLPFLYRTDLRALAMGNAFVPVARGENALTYNPAGLVQYGFDVKLDAGLMAEGESGPFFKDTYKVLGNPSATEVQNYLAKYLGTSQNYRAETFYNAVANLAALHIGLGAGVMKQERFQLSFVDNGGTPGSADPTDTLVLSEQDLDIKLASFGFQMLDGQLLLGATLKSFTYQNKTGSATFGSVGTNIQINTAGASYAGSGYDLGMIWRIETFSALRGQWSLVANNVGGITLQKSGFPTYEAPASYDVGLAINPEIKFIPVHLIVSVQEDDITNAVKVHDPVGGLDHPRSTGQRLHAGMELGFWETATGNNLLSVRVGSNRGGSTEGVELNIFSGFRLLYTRYHDDYGWDGAPQVHTFQAVQLSLGLAF